MAEQESVGRGAERVALHVLAVIAGIILMFVGLAMGVSLVLLPIGVPVGLVGLGAFLWGLFGRSEPKQSPL